MGECAREPTLRIPYLGERPGLHLERKCPRVSPHAWTNDPVSDSSGEAFYIRDEERGHFWSPTPLPSPGAMPYVSRHGFGYSVFEYTAYGIRSELWVYVALDASAKFAVLKVRNECGRSRRLSVTGTWNGCWEICGQNRPCTSSPKWTRQRCAFRAEPIPHGVRRPGCFFQRGRCGSSRKRRPNGVHRA